MTDPPIAKTEALSAEEEAVVRSRHDPYETGFFGGSPPSLACRQCSRPWPCDGSRLLATLDAARGQAATEARRELLAKIGPKRRSPGPSAAFRDGWNDCRDFVLRLIAESSPSTEEPTDG